MENTSETVDSGPKEPTEDGKPSLTFWRSQLEAYDNAAKEWALDVDAAFDEYLNVGQRGKASEKKNGARLPLFWSCVRTIQPAFYSRTPVVVTEKAFKEMRDPVARLAAIMYERLGKYGTKTSGFDRAMGLAVTHFIMSEKASVRVVFDSAITETEKRSFYTPVQIPIPGPDGQMMLQTDYVGEDGETFTGEVQQDEEGNYYSAETEHDIEYIKCETEPWHYKDARHTPNARHQGEIDWLSFDTQLTRSDVSAAFGDEAAQKLTYGPLAQKDDHDRKREVKGLPSHYATVTEIWDLKKRKVYYLAAGCNEWLQHVNNPDGGDPYKLKDFFPCAPFMLGTHGPDDMFTSPAFVQLRDLIEQVHGAFDRVRRLVLAMKAAGVFDASKAPILAELNGLTQEGQFIGIPNLEELLGPGGSLDRLIHFFPTDKLAKAVADLKAVVADLKQELFDLWGIPDIYRGISDPNETLGAQQLKGKHMSVRFSVLQREVQRLARDTLEIICDLYLGKVPDFKLAEIMGFQFMTPEEQQVFPQALALLKSDSERCIRLEIETDSTITQDMNANIEQMNYQAKTLFEGIGALKDVSPALMPVASKAVELVIKSLQQGKHMEDELEEALQHMVEASQNPQPAPDPEMMKVQAKLQLQQQDAQMKAGLAQQKAQQDMQIKWATAQADMAIEKFMAENKLYQEERKAAQGLQLEMLDAQHQQQLAQLEGSLQIYKEQMKMKLELEKHEAKIENEKQTTEAKVGAVGKPKGGGASIHIGPQIEVKG